MSEYFRDTLGNGLRVITVEMPHLHSCEMACYVDVGSRHETPELAGICHFLEHILFRGTADYPESYRLERAFEALGGAVNASTDSECTCFHSRLHPRHVREGAALFASMLCRPLFSELEMERQVIMEEALEELNEQGEDISPDNLSARLLWPGHPLSLPTLGTRDSIARIGEEDLRRHHAAFFTPARTVLAVAGRVSRSDVVAAAESAFGAWGAAAAHESPPEPPPQPPVSPATCWVRDSDSQINMQLAFSLPGRGDPRTIDLRVLRWILSWGGASRLMLRLREKLGLTYSADANLALFADCGCLSIDMALAPAKLVPAVKETIAIIEELRNELVGSEELEGVVQAFLFDLDFNRDHVEAATARFGWGEMAAYLRTSEQDRREVAGVTPERLRETARALLGPQLRKAVVVGPYRPEDRDRVERLLAGD
ncbi:MAG: insulinase family protein [Desulfuromonas sp.]|uniref:M16 family metallopeptidase n=1 Tax=Desulfuromonas sp. TaxID=892 RepID=UPI000CBEE9A4|nr:pitrilysin family protein [Desulfuromonas sp.]PLX85480.1 MAG: insulinase family protein [Desulfuromonas sp.]